MSFYSLVNLLILLDKTIGRLLYISSDILKAFLQKDDIFLLSIFFALTAYCDVDWTCCIDNIKSLRWLCFCRIFTHFMENTETDYRLWSSIEAEYKSIVSLVCELQWISCVLSDFRFSFTYPSGVIIKHI